MPQNHNIKVMQQRNVSLYQNNTVSNI